mmetsp:Transcript_267/g.725  ORF Transcript_267/g.725 Transcript_267/m.725 type:complete len:315 (+) Transcript_267:418-1362(+)
MVHAKGSQGGGGGQREDQGMAGRILWQPGVHRPHERRREGRRESCRKPREAARRRQPEELEVHPEKAEQEDQPAAEDRLLQTAEDGGGPHPRPSALPDQVDPAQRAGGCRLGRDPVSQPSVLPQGPGGRPAWQRRHRAGSRHPRHARHLHPGRPDGGPQAAVLQPRGGRDPSPAPAPAVRQAPHGRLRLPRRELQARGQDDPPQGGGAARPEAPAPARRPGHARRVRRCALLRPGKDEHEAPRRRRDLRADFQLARDEGPALGHPAERGPEAQHGEAEELRRADTRIAASYRQVVRAGADRGRTVRTVPAQQGP